MKKIISLALAALLAVFSVAALAQDADRYYAVTLSNPGFSVERPDHEPQSFSLTGLELSYERGLSEEGMSYAFDLSAGDNNAVRAIVIQNLQGIIAGIDGMSTAFSIPLSANPENDAASKLDLSALIDLTKDVNFLEAGTETQEFMYGAKLSANKYSLKLDSNQINDMIDAFGKIFPINDLDAEGFKTLEKSIEADLWLTPDNTYSRLDCAISCANCDQSIVVPITILGKQNSNGTIDITFNMTESDAQFVVAAHITPDQEHPMHPSAHVSVSVLSGEEEIATASVISSCVDFDDSTTCVLSVKMNAMGEEVFKLLASKKESGETTAYTFSAGLNDELTAYCSTDSYKDEAGKGEKGTIELNVNTEELKASFNADLTMGPRLGVVDTCEIASLNAVELKDIDEKVMSEAKTDLMIIGIRAIGVLTDIPEVSALIESALAE